MKELTLFEKHEYDQLMLASQLAFTYHEGQKRLDGTHYIFHPISVMMKCPTIQTKIVALLHDILEDTDCDLRTLVVSFPREIWQAVQLLTRRTLTYGEYIEDLKDNELARTVKIADLEHNMETIHHIPDEDKRRELHKLYWDALEYLTGHKIR